MPSPRLRELLLVSFAVAAGSSFLACNRGESSCLGAISAASTVVVVDATTGDFICDATVVAALPGGATSEPFSVVRMNVVVADGGKAPCAYFFQTDVTTGEYTLAASAPGYGVTTAADFTYFRQGCEETGDDDTPATNPEVALTLAPRPDAGS